MKMKNQALISPPWRTLRSPRRPIFHLKPRAGRPAAFLAGLAIGALLAGGSARAQELPAFKPALQRQLEARILPEVRFEDADLMEALAYLQMQALTPAENAVRVPFLVQLPADFKPRYELTLHLKAVPFWEALRHLGGQAGVEFSVGGDSVRVRPSSTAAPAKTMVRTVIPVPAAPAPDRMAGRLGNPARPFGRGGNNNHYSTSGVLQPQRSGTVKNRNLSGWSVEVDPGNRFSMNCIDIAKCKLYKTQGGETPLCPCGCFACACQLPVDEKKPAPSP